MKESRKSKKKAEDCLYMCQENLDLSKDLSRSIQEVFSIA